MPTARVVDFETTGFGDGAQVCEVGLCDVEVEGRSVADPDWWLCEVDEMPPEARSIHHITYEECLGHDRFDQAMADEFMRGADVMVAHNAEYELGFFDPGVPVICTYKCGLRAWPEAPSHGNGALCYWLEDAGIVEMDRAKGMPSHRAGPDAYVTAQIFVSLLGLGLTGRDMVEWSREPAVLPRCPIGEHRGKAWSDVPVGFLRWMVGKDGMESDYVWNAQRELDRRGGE